MKKLSKKKKIRSFIFVVVGVLLIAGCISYLVYNSMYNIRFRVINFDKDFIVNYGSSYQPNIDVCYGSSNNCIKVEPTVEGEVNTNEIGEYQVRYKYVFKDKEIVLDQFVKVQDVEGPSIDIKNENDLKVCPNGKVLNLDADIKDNFSNEDIQTEYELKDDILTIILTDKNNNKSYKEVKVNPKDSEGPEITLNGLKSMVVNTNNTYNEQGAKAVDECDGEVDVKIDGTVDSSKQDKYTITYTAKDSSGNETKVTRTVTVRDKQPGEKVIYLTFDDGPGAYTGQLLDVLKKYDVKATFFVTCKGDDSLIKREYDEGHTVALHTCSHNYSQIYASYNAYFKDLDQVKARVKRITGYDANIIRFPGGTSNGVSPNISMKSLAKQVLDKGYYYFDWNVSSGDAGGQTTSDGVYYAVINSLKSGSSVVLQHDIKKFSVEAVERIIQYGQANGYTFERLREDSPKIRHGAGH